MLPTVQKKLTIPDVAGLHVDDARIVLSHAGFEKTKLHYVESYEPEDHVVEQFPLKGMIALPIEPVVLQVSKTSLVNYLPSIFRSGAATSGRSFIKEFLWIFSHFFDDIGTTLDSIHELFDPKATPEGFLPWLAGWLGLVLESDWDEVRRRRFIKEAAKLYSWRGTKRSIERFVELYTGVKPKVHENVWPYKGFRVARTIIGVDSIILPEMNLSHCFVVEFPVGGHELAPEDIILIHKVIQMEKPAHTSYYLRFKELDEALEVTGILRIGVDRIGVHAVTSTPHDN